MRKYLNEMNNHPDDIHRLTDIPKIQLILTKDENFYEVQQEEKEEVANDPFSNLNNALLEQKKGLKENHGKEEAKINAERREAQMRGRRGSMFLYKYKSIAVIKKTDDFASVTFDIELVNEEKEPAMMLDLYNLINKYHDKAYRLKFTSNTQICRCQRHPKTGELSCEPNNLKIKDFI